MKHLLLMIYAMNFVILRLAEVTSAHHAIILATNMIIRIIFCDSIKIVQHLKEMMVRYDNFSIITNLQFTIAKHHLQLI